MIWWGWWGTPDRTPPKHGSMVFSWVFLTLSRIRIGWGTRLADPCIGGAPSSGGSNCHKQDGQIITMTIRLLRNLPNHIASLCPMLHMGYGKKWSQWSYTQVLLKIQSKGKSKLILDMALRNHSAIFTWKIVVCKDEIMMALEEDILLPNESRRVLYWYDVYWLGIRLLITG